MNNSNNQLQNNEPQCCVDYCQTSFQVANKEVVNVYKCNQKRFSASDLWNIQRNKRDVLRRSAF